VKVARQEAEYLSRYLFPRFHVGVPRREGPLGNGNGSASERGPAPKDAIEAGAKPFVYMHMGSLAYVGADRWLTDRQTQTDRHVQTWAAWPAAASASMADRQTDRQTIGMQRHRQIDACKHRQPGLRRRRQLYDFSMYLSVGAGLWSLPFCLSICLSIRLGAGL
jgi:hypothetical protein